MSIKSNVLDFNEQILKLQKGLESEGAFNTLKNYKLELEELMQKFVNPPQKYSETYKKLIELYGIYS